MSLACLVLLPEDSPIGEPFTIDTYLEKFMKKLNEDWKDNTKAFSNLFHRVLICSSLIRYLAELKKKEKAIEIFQEAKKLEAWNPNIGFNYYYTTEKIEKICYNFFQETVAVLNIN